MDWDVDKFGVDQLHRLRTGMAGTKDLDMNTGRLSLKKA
jgi:hypothetical protein